MQAAKKIMSLKVLVCLLFIAVAAITTTTSASALSNVSPNPSDMFAIRSNGSLVQGGVSHLLKKESVARIVRLKAGAYFRNDNSAKTLRIEYGIDGKKCFQRFPNDPGAVEVTIGSLVYRIPFDRICNNRGNPARDNIANGSGTQAQRDNNKFFANYRIPTNQISYNSALRLYYTPITIAYTSNVQQRGSMENNVNFTLELNESSAIVAPLKNSEPDEFGLRSAFVPDAPHGFLIRVAFGAPCSLPQNDRIKTVGLYDADVNIFGSTYLHVSEGGNSLARGRYQNPQRVDWQPADVRWRSTAIEGSQSTRDSFVDINRIKPGANYRFIIRNLDNKSNSGNVLSIGIPFDSIWSEVDCNFNLDPSVDRPNPFPETFSGGTPDFRVGGRITPSGNDQQDHLWRLTVRTYNSRPNQTGATNDDLPCNWKPGTSCKTMESGTKNNGFQSIYQTSLSDNNMPTNVPLGTWVCFVMSVQEPTQDSEANEWRHSALQCSVRGKQPKAQVRGHDLRTVGGVNTSLELKDNRYYGSWGEYGVMTNGCNAYSWTGSGASARTGVLSGTPAASWHRLTFANQPPILPACPLGGPGTYGKFGGVSAYVADTYRTGTIEDHSADTTATIGAITINQSTPSNQKKRVLYYPNATVTINGNIRYDGDYSSVHQLPRLIIIAKNIIVDRDVRQIDAWLIARSGGTAPSGNISTCDLRDYSASANNFTQTGAPLTASRCNEILTFNGPVMANRIFLHRTGGSTDSNIGQPAEIFNLRADVFLSSLSGNDNPVATTDVVTELPPRF